MNGINTNFGSEQIYTRKSSIASCANDGAFASLISEAQKMTETNEANYDFSDMYVRTHQATIEDVQKDTSAVARQWGNEKYMQIPVAGDLKELMESIEKGFANGESLKSVLQNRIDRYYKEPGLDGASNAADCCDRILIDPETGKVIDSIPNVRCVVLSKEIQNMDYDTARSQADDLATFIRYTVFKKETDDPEKVSALLSELKEKQSDYDTSRFLPIFSANGELGERNGDYWCKIKSELNDLSEDERNEAADELLKILEKRYSSKTNADDDLLEVIDQMKAENIGKSQITKTVLNNALFKMY